LNPVKTNIGCDFFCRDIEVGDRKVTLQLWDTCGQERFQGLGVSFYRGTDGVFFVYDVTRPDTLDQLDYWIKSFLAETGRNFDSDFPFAIIGNKIDLEDRKVHQSQIDEFMAKYPSIPYFECSAKHNTNTIQPVQKIAEMMVPHRDTQDFLEETLNSDNDFILSDPSASQVSGCTC